jgi:hypothetical protein
VKVVKITVVRHRIADECVVHTEMPNLWPDAPPNDTIKLVFVVPAGKAAEYCQQHFPGVPFESNRVKEQEDLLMHYA